jgi:SAM-dependent methyltransferase
MANHHDYDSTRRSWNVATRNHNAHKGDQARFFREGGDVLFPEEVELLGDLAGKRVVHLQCNAGQDTLGLARRGARVLGVDMSDEAIAFAAGLSAGAGIPAEFVRSEVVAWMHGTPLRFDLAFSSYGFIGWLPDVDAWARGVARILVPGGRFVGVEFHPLVWSLGDDLRPTGPDYFFPGPFTDPVGDYVAASGGGLAAEPGSVPLANDIPAWSWQHRPTQVVDALARAGLVLETLRDYPHSNGCRLHPALVPGPDRTWVWPPGVARLPLMYGFTARRPG